MTIRDPASGAKAVRQGDLDGLANIDVVANGYAVKCAGTNSRHGLTDLAVDYGGGHAGVDYDLAGVLLATFVVRPSPPGGSVSVVGQPNS